MHAYRLLYSGAKKSQVSEQCQKITNLQMSNQKHEKGMLIAYLFGYVREMGVFWDLARWEAVIRRFIKSQVSHDTVKNGKSG